MIDFENSTFSKLSLVNNVVFNDTVSPLLTANEKIVYTYQGIRDGVVFTSHRIIAINVQGVTGKKKAITTLPYIRIQAYAMETAGVADIDSELTLWFSGLGKVKFEFTRGSSVAKVYNLITNRIIR